MSKIYNTAKCEDEARKASQAFTKFLNTTYDDAPGFREQACKLSKAWQDAERVYNLALAEDGRIQQELDYAMMIEVAIICMEAHHE
jgi:hypothetical protein